LSTIVLKTNFLEVFRNFCSALICLRFHQLILQASSLSLSLLLTHTHTLSLSRTHTHIYTHSLSLNLSLLHSLFLFLSLSRSLLHFTLFLLSLLHTYTLLPLPLPLLISSYCISIKASCASILGDQTKLMKNIFGASIEQQFGSLDRKPIIIFFH